MFWDQLLAFLVSLAGVVVLAFLPGLDLHEACQPCQGVQRENYQPPTDQNTGRELLNLHPGDQQINNLHWTTLQH